MARPTDDEFILESDADLGRLVSTSFDEPVQRQFESRGIFETLTTIKCKLPGGAMQVEVIEMTLGKNGGAVAKTHVLSDEVLQATTQRYFYTYVIGIRLRPASAPDCTQYTPCTALPLPEMPGVVVVFDFLIEEPGAYDKWPADETMRSFVASALLEKYRSRFRRPA